MKEGRKLYSLILKDENGAYYRLKIDDDYRHPLAVIDAFTISQTTTKYKKHGNEYFYGIYSQKLDTEIVDAKIVYQKNGMTKALSPVYAKLDSLENGIINLSSIDRNFGNSSELDFNNLQTNGMNVLLFTKQLMHYYNTDKNVRMAFDLDGDYIVKQALLEGDEKALLKSLCEYRKVRRSVLLLKATCQHKKINVYPEVYDLEEKEIIKSDKRRYEVVEKQIDKLQNTKVDNPYLEEENEKKLKELYNEREELLSSLDTTSKNQINGQMRLF